MSLEEQFVEAMEGLGYHIDNDETVVYILNSEEVIASISKEQYCSVSTAWEAFETISDTNKQIILHYLTKISTIPLEDRKIFKVIKKEPPSAEELFNELKHHIDHIYKMTFDVKYHYDDKKDIHRIYHNRMKSHFDLEEANHMKHLFHKIFGMNNIRNYSFDFNYYSFDKFDFKTEV